MEDVELIQVIRTRLLRRGKGVSGDPIRIITQYWSTDGTLLAEVDPEQTIKKELPNDNTN